jgi:hypothetical protein
MKPTFIPIKVALFGLLLLTATGCFRVSSETRALRDAALDNGLKGADEKIELALGRLTFSAANFGLSFVQSQDIPPEARMLLNSVKGAEVSVHQFDRGSGDLSKILAAADRALEKRGCERLVGVINDRNLVAVYVPRKMRSAKDIRFSVLILNDENLVCASARGDVRAILDFAMAKAHEQLPPPVVASNN